MKNRKILWIALSVILTIIVLFLSSKSGDASLSQSGRVVDFFKGMLDKIGLSYDVIKLGVFVRKMAHFLEYCCLGLFWCKALWEFRKKRDIGLTCFLGVIFIAIIDEFFIQGTTSGRYSSWKDVIIDGSGAAVGVIVVLLVYEILLMKKNDM